jgi:hypothetical protein
MNKIDNFKVFILYSGDVITDVNHLHVKRRYLINFSYIIIENYHGRLCVEVETSDVRYVVSRSGQRDFVCCVEGLARTCRTYLSPAKHSLSGGAA